MRCRINCLEPAPLEPPGWEEPDPEPWSLKTDTKKIFSILMTFSLQIWKNSSTANGPVFLTSALAPRTGESIFRFFLGPIAASAVRLASLCLIWASSCCCIWNAGSNAQISFTNKQSCTCEWMNACMPSLIIACTCLFGLLFKSELLGVLLPWPWLQ